MKLWPLIIKGGKWLQLCKFKMALNPNTTNQPITIQAFDKCMTLTDYTMVIHVALTIVLWVH